MIPHNVRGVNIDLSARCTLECPMCSRTKLKKQGLKVPGEDVTFEQFKKIADYFNYICIASRTQCVPTDNRCTVV